MTGSVPDAGILEQNVPTPSSQKLSAALAAAQAPPVPVRFPVEESSRSVAEMAQRDLDAALQLLADRAQYITGASGAAIALRRDGRNDMLCRASSGSNAPELGALLSTEFGLSGESVRTRQLLRCDDAERDARVNREVCRQLGIASVLVMPVVNDDQVLGVFELFSGKANAFGERDLSAVQRLSEMVETAVRLAHAAETLPAPGNEQASLVTAGTETEVLEGQFLSDLVIEEPDAPLVPAARTRNDGLESAAKAAAAELPKADVAAPADAPIPSGAQPAAVPPAPAAVAPEPAPATPLDAPKKPLFWSAALDSEAASNQPAEADQTHVPPVMRGLHKCAACGFPVSAGRVLCVECEEKKWRGQLRTSLAASRAATAKPTVSVPQTVASPTPQKSAAQAFAAAAPSMAKAAEVVPVSSPSAGQSTKVFEPSKPVASSVAQPVVPAAPLAKPAILPASSMAVFSAANPEPVPEKAVEAVKSASPTLVLSAALPPSQSWLARNKYVLGVLLAIAAAAAVFFLR